MPAPGGLFQSDGWTETPYGPVPAAPGLGRAAGWTPRARSGWALLVEATIEQVAIPETAPPLIHFRGRYASRLTG